MRYLIAALILLLPLSSAADPCPKQIYTDDKAEPDYDCPGPGEAALVPQLQLQTSVALSVKDKVPWPGILMDKNRVMVLGLRIKGLRRLRYLDMKSAREKLSNEVKFVKADSKAELDLRTSQRDNYKSQTVEMAKEISSLKSWYRSGPFWFAVGVVTATAGTLAAVMASK